MSASPAIVRELRRILADELRVADAAGEVDLSLGPQALDAAVDLLRQDPELRTRPADDWERLVIAVAHAVRRSTLPRGTTVDVLRDLLRSSA